MKKLLVFIKGNMFLFLWGFSLILSIIAFFIIVTKDALSGQAIALKYSVVAGVTIKGKNSSLFVMPLLGLIIIIANFALFLKIKNYAFLRVLSVATAIIVQMIIIAAIIFLIQVN